MDGLTLSLLATAAAVALTHTALGPDHYLPFVVLARARGWPTRRLVAVTAACGCVHVATSLVVASLGLALGAALGRLDALDSVRGDLAAWGLVAFGLAYGMWGIRRALRRSHGLAPHVHGCRVHVHRGGDRPHEHTRHVDSSVTFWALLTLFVVGPCEPLLPLFLLPASRGRWGTASAVAVVFALVTVGTMVALSVAGARGLRRLPAAPLERWSHALAGGVIAVSGIAVLSLGL